MDFTKFSSLEELLKYAAIDPKESTDILFELISTLSTADPETFEEHIIASLQELAEASVQNELNVKGHTLQEAKQYMDQNTGGYFLDNLTINAKRELPNLYNIVLFIARKLKASSTWSDALAQAFQTQEQRQENI